MSDILSNIKLNISPAFLPLFRVSLSLYILYLFDLIIFKHNVCHIVERIVEHKIEHKIEHFTCISPPFLETLSTFTELFDQIIFKHNVWNIFEHNVKHISCISPPFSNLSLSLLLTFFITNIFEQIIVEHKIDHITCISPPFSSLSTS
jgi:hypothetical protein